MKKLLSTTLTLLLVIGLGTSTLKAEEKPEPYTEVIVEFEDKVVVIDPDKPGTDPEEVDPGDGSSIQIWKVPSELEFKAKRSNKNQVVVSAEGAAPTYGVFDFHSKKTKWSLSAQLGELKVEPESDEKLVGAKLEWNEVKIQRVTNVTNEKDKQEYEDVNYVEGAEVEEGAKVSLEAGEGDEGLIQVMKATDGVLPKNNGHFEGKMEDLGLVIPAFQGNPDTTYTGTITWTLGEPVISKGE